jgi:hypothetical protein
VLRYVSVSFSLDLRDLFLRFDLSFFFGREGDVVVCSGDFVAGKYDQHVTFSLEVSERVLLAMDLPFRPWWADILELLGRSCTRYAIHLRDLCWLRTSYVRAFSISHLNQTSH